MLDREARELGASPTDAARGDVPREVVGQPQPAARREAGEPVAADVLIHTQDIRRAAGHAARHPAGTAPARRRHLSVLDDRLPCEEAHRGPAAARRPTSTGRTDRRGPEVVGPAEALIMAMGGRPAALTDLSGDGVATLESRVGA